MSEDVDLLPVLRQLETELHQPAARSHRDRLDTLLHDDFLEFEWAARVWMAPVYAWAREEGHGGKARLRLYQIPSRIFPANISAACLSIEAEQNGSNRYQHFGRKNFLNSLEMAVFHNLPRHDARSGCSLIR